MNTWHGAVDDNNNRHSIGRIALGWTEHSYIMSSNSLSKGPYPMPVCCVSSVFSIRHQKKRVTIVTTNFDQPFSRGMQQLKVKSIHPPRRLLFVMRSSIFKGSDSRLRASM